MKRVVIESPYRSSSLDEFNTHLHYARQCMHDSLMRGESPYLSHLIYTQVLNDDVPAQRKLGIECGLKWGECADLIAVYIDHDISTGMSLGIQYYQERGIPIEMRSLNDKKDS